MSRTPRVTGSDLVAALAKAGFRLLRVKGSHHFLRHEDGRSTVVAVHSGETLGPGLLHKVLRDCNLNVDGPRRYFGPGSRAAVAGIAESGVLYEALVKHARAAYPGALVT